MEEDASKTIKFFLIYSSTLDPESRKNSLTIRGPRPPTHRVFALSSEELRRLYRRPMWCYYARAARKIEEGGCRPLIEGGVFHPKEAEDPCIDCVYCGSWGWEANGKSSVKGLVDRGVA